MAKKIKLSEQGLKKLAKTFKYTGDMSKFKDFLASDPAKQHLVNNYLKKVMKAAKGGVVGYSTGGMTQEEAKAKLKLLILYFTIITISLLFVYHYQFRKMCFLTSIMYPHNFVRAAVFTAPVLLIVVVI